MKWFVGLEDEVSLPRDPNTVGYEVMGEDGGIRLVVGLIPLALVNLRQRFVSRGRVCGGGFCGPVTCGSGASGSSALAAKAGRHRITAASNSQGRIKTPRGMDDLARG